MDISSLTPDKQVKLQYWLDVIRQCRASGLTNQAWCEQNQISLKSYYYWIAKIRRLALEELPRKRNGIHPQPDRNTILLPEASSGFTEVSLPDAGQREELLKDLPHSKVLHTIDESEQACEKCGNSMVRVGEEFVCTEVQFIPASLKVIDHYRETYECRSCRKQGTPYMEKAPVPYPPVLHSLASASTIAWLVHQKFELGIPLYRQEKEWEALGLKVGRATMPNWLLAVFRDWHSHVVRRLKQELLKQDRLHIDETRVQVLKEPGRKNTSDSYMWVYCSIKDAETPIRYFEYQPGLCGCAP